LGQAVKAAALRHARDVLQVTVVRTHHNAENLPMIAIDKKFGYVQTPGILLMKKILSQPSGG
jgi:RimJ/RimL family protein N-acetyltransferase